MRGDRWILGHLLIVAFFVGCAAQKGVSDSADKFTVTAPNDNTTTDESETTTPIGKTTSTVPTTTTSYPYQLSKDKHIPLKLYRNEKKAHFGAFEIVAIVGSVINIFIVGLGFILRDLYYDRIFSRIFCWNNDKKQTETTDDENVFSKTVTMEKNHNESVDKA